MSLVFISREFINSIKEKFQKGERRWTDAAFELHRKADACMRLGPWSVTYHPSPMQGEPHDYYSEGPYWWPNPENPAAPYIRRDGEVNPERFNYHSEHLADMAQTVMFLALAGFYLGVDAYSDRAEELVRVWFINEKTKMNPHLEHGQAIRGICSGRGIGIIDTARLLAVIYAAGFLEQNKRYTQTVSELKEWFASYAHWMNTSIIGLEEKHYFNNHANWWNTQAAAYSAFSGGEALLAECLERFCNTILPEQMDKDGSFTDEIHRTRSFHYSLFNLEAGALLCEIAYQRGVDLWRFETPEGKGMKRGIEFMLPYLENPFLWPYQQIDGKITGDDISLQLGGLRLDLPRCREINLLRGTDHYLIRDACHIGPLALLPGAEI